MDLISELPQALSIPGVMNWPIDVPPTPGSELASARPHQHGTSTFGRPQTVKLDFLLRWLARPAADATHGRTQGAPHPPAQPSPLTSILQVDEAQLAADRDAVAQLQHDTFQRVRRLQGDIQGVASRHAEVRVTGGPAEKAALVRIFASLKVQLSKAEQFHADLLNHRQLLDNLCSAREFAALRLRLQQGVLAGMGFAELRRLVDASVAAELQGRTQTTELLDEWSRVDEDGALQDKARHAEAEAELSALSELEYQQRARAQMLPLEAGADRMDLGLQIAGMDAPAVPEIRTTST